MSQLKVIVSGGGTGGHIFPAVAIANAIKKKYPSAQIKFVGAKGKMEMEKVPKAGYPIEGLWISGLQRKLTLDNLMFPFKLISSLWEARKILKAFKPDLAIGVGGYASGPLLKAATWRNIPTLIHESNSYPGITNRLLGKKVSTVCVAFQGMEAYFPKGKIVITGNPVRQEILKLTGKRERAIEHFNLDPHKPVVLVIGGSQGALSINKAIETHLSDFTARGYQLLWQTGKFYFEKAQQATALLNDSALQSHEFIYEMDLAYAVADIVISRAGAMSVTELAIAGKPAILVPLPSAAEDHQTKNAMTLVVKEAAVLVENHKVQEELFEAVDEILSDDFKREKLSKNIKELAITDADQLILREVERLVIEKIKG